MDGYRLQSTAKEIIQHFQKNQQLFLNLKSQMWDKRAHLHKIIKGKFVSLCFFTISSALSFLLLINISSSLL